MPTKRNEGVFKSDVSRSVQADFEQIDYQNYDYTVKRKQRLIVDEPTDMELLEIEMCQISKPEPEEPRQPPTLYKIETRPVNHPDFADYDHFRQEKLQ